MLVRKADRTARVIEDCHGGAGVLHCTEMLAEYRRPGAGFRYVHDNIIEPGASIGEHTHRGDEELYIILEGHGTMRIDGQHVPVGPGDVCVTRSGHSHSLTNSADGPMHMLVVCTGLG
jgi:mannose-6-phosphate isomerase-like protein (cupin superfamily)